MKRDLLKIGGKRLNIGKVLTRKGKTVGDFINELEPNIERIIANARINGREPFRDSEHLKNWLISNQEGYEKFNYEIFCYFADKLRLPIKKETMEKVAAK